MATTPMIELDRHEAAFDGTSGGSEPLQILRDYAEALTQEYKGLLSWFVNERRVPVPIDFPTRGPRKTELVSVDLLAKIDDGSEYTFSIVDLFYQTPVADPQKPYPIQVYRPGGEWVDIKDGKQFRDWLTEELQSPDVREIIARMLKFSAAHSHSGNS